MQKSIPLLKHLIDQQTRALRHQRHLQLQRIFWKFCSKSDSSAIQLGTMAEGVTTIINPHEKKTGLETVDITFKLLLQDLAAFVYFFSVQRVDFRNSIIYKHFWIWELVVYFVHFGNFQDMHFHPSYDLANLIRRARCFHGIVDTC